MVAAGQHVVVLGDLNEGLKKVQGTDPGEYISSENFDQLLGPGGPLVDCYALDAFEMTERLGTFDSSGPPDNWETYPEMTESAHQASDHALVYIDLDLG